MAKYECWYTFGGSKKSAVSEYGRPVFCDGFWVTKDFEYTNMSNARYWIPPNAIAFIEKLPAGEKDG